MHLFECTKYSPTIVTIGILFLAYTASGWNLGFGSFSLKRLSNAAHNNRRVRTATEEVLQDKETFLSGGSGTTRAQSEACYRVVVRPSSPSDFHEAREYCRMQGSDLAGFETKSEWESIRNKVFDFQPGDYWLASSDTRHEGTWLWETTCQNLNYQDAWTDTSNNNMKNCLVGKINKDTVAAKKGFVPADCKTKSPFWICEQRHGKCRPPPKGHNVKKREDGSASKSNKVDGEGDNDGDGDDGVDTNYTGFNFTPFELPLYRKSGYLNHVRKPRQTLADTCYSVVHNENDKLSWYDAKEECRASKRGDLTPIENQMQYKFIDRLTEGKGDPSSGVKLFWLAGTDEPQEGKFIWDATCDSFFPNITWWRNTNGADRNCVAYRSGNTVSDKGLVVQRCDMKLAYICKKTTKHCQDMAEEMFKRELAPKEKEQPDNNEKARSHHKRENGDGSSNNTEPVMPLDPNGIGFIKHTLSRAICFQYKVFLEFKVLQEPLRRKSIYEPDGPRCFYYYWNNNCKPSNPTSCKKFQDVDCDDVDRK